jgi:eukaryotic-like serine/threonine-protein kinase
MKSFHKQPTLMDVNTLERPPSLLPLQIGVYKIESLLNKSDKSLLYMGVHPVTREVLVIKVLSPKFVKNTEMVNFFLKESKIIGIANHPNIIKLYDEGAWDGGLYIAMEFIRGVSLRQFIEQHSLSIKRSLDIILQVAYALAHLHSHGVVHGDLKPENILITENGQVKVIDFGIAKLYEEAAKENSNKIAGTPTYMSPEQKEGRSKITFASDIYALGIIAYELFSGKLSFGIVHLSQVPKGLRPFLEKALAVSLKERYCDVIHFISDLLQYIKLGGLDKDRPGTDQLKEIVETIQQAAQSLSSPTPLPCFFLEIAFAKCKVLGYNSLYFDSFKLPGNGYAMVIAEPMQKGLETPIFVSNLRGIVRSLIFSQTTFSFHDFMVALNRIVCEDPLKKLFKFSLVTFSPSKDELSFLSCGFGNLIQFSPESQEPRILMSQHSLLGAQPQAEFQRIVHNWTAGDAVIFHSFPELCDATIQESLKSVTSFSPQHQADTILKKLSSLIGPSYEKKTGVLFSIHRIV